MNKRGLIALLSLVGLGAGVWWFYRQRKMPLEIDSPGASRMLEPNRQDASRLIPTKTGDFLYDPLFDLFGTTPKKVFLPLPTEVTAQTPAPSPAHKYSVPPQGFQYLKLIRQAEQANAIPPMLLARLLEQESGFRDDVIKGQTMSPSGAIGIAQVMPRTAANPGFGVSALNDPTDPRQAIPWAARYLKALYNYMGSWRLALAAYNWGAGNVKKNPNFDQWPTETKNYVQQIVLDVPVK